MKKLKLMFILLVLTVGCNADSDSDSDGEKNISSGSFLKATLIGDDIDEEFKSTDITATKTAAAGNVTINIFSEPTADKFAIQLASSYAESAPESLAYSLGAHHDDMKTTWTSDTRADEAFPSGTYYRITNETDTFIEGEFQFTANRKIGTFGGEELQVKSGSFKAKKLIWK